MLSWISTKCAITNVQLFKNTETISVNLRLFRIFTTKNIDTGAPQGSTNKIHLLNLFIKDFMSFLIERLFSNYVDDTQQSAQNKKIP